MVNLVPCPLCGEPIPGKGIFPRNGTVAFSIALVYSYGGWGDNKDGAEVAGTICNSCYIKVLNEYNQFIQRVHKLKNHNAS